MAKPKRHGPATPAEYADEAVRYYHNARKILRAVPIHQERYSDVKPVREACGTAYLAVLAGIRGFLLQRGVPASSLPESYEAYGSALARHGVRNGKLRTTFQQAYTILHLDGYYRGFQDVESGKLAFGRARFLIERLTGRNLT